MSNARFEPHFGITSNADDVSVIAVVSGTAAADCTGLAPIAIGATGPLAMDVNGRLITLAIGNVANDIPDACNPVKIGGVAVLTPSTGQAVAVGVGDRVNAAFDINGRQIVAAGGDVANDDPDAGRPVKIGGYAEDQAPATVSAVGDRVNGYFDRQGREQVNQEKAIAGENLVLNVLRTVRGKLAVEQESWQTGVIAAASTSIIKAAAGRLGRLQIVNTTAAGAHVLIIDNTTAVVGGNGVRWRGYAPAIAGTVPGVLDISFAAEDGLYCEIGISVATSDNPTTIANPVSVSGSFMFV